MRRLIRQESSISKMTGCGIYDYGSIPDKGMDISLYHEAQTETWAHPDSHPVDIRGSFPGKNTTGV
jgi:hypothetical protein